MKCEGDKNTVHPILYWLLNNLDALRILAAVKCQGLVVVMPGGMRELWLVENARVQIKLTLCLRKACLLGEVLHESGGWSTHLQ